MPSTPLDAYQSIEKATLNGRDLEASVLIKAAARLAAVKQDWGAANRDESLDEALRFNQQLWTLFQAELASKENPNSDEVKRNLLALSAFVDKRTYDIMSFPEPGKLDILIDINTNIAGGLKGESLPAP